MMTGEEYGQIEGKKLIDFLKGFDVKRTTVDGIHVILVEGTEKSVMILFIPDDNSPLQVVCPQDETEKYCENADEIIEFIKEKLL